MSGPAQGLTRKMWLKTETTYDTYVAFAATDAVDLIDLKIEPDVEQIERESHIGTASLQGHIAGNEANKWSLESYVLAGAAGVAPDIGPLLEHALGDETIVGGTSVTYEPLDTNRSVGLQIGVAAGDLGEVYERANGAWCEKLSIEANQGEPPKISASGGFARYSLLRAGAACTAVEPIAETTIAVDTSESYCLVGQPIVGFGADFATMEDNGDAGYQVTSISYSADTFVVSPALAGATEIGDLVLPVYPSQTLTGSLVGGCENTVTIGGTSLGLIKAKIDIDTGIIGMRDGTSARPIRLMSPAKRRITGEIELYALEENSISSGKPWNNQTAAINLQFGTSAAARIKIQMPAAFLKVVKPAWSDEDAYRVTLSFTAQQSAAAKDEIDIILD